MKNFNLNTANADEWLTPPDILSALGPFDLDPCAPVSRPWDMAARHYTVDDDGLSRPWEGRVWLNPPYGTRTFEWMARLAEHKQGIALIFARTETRGFHSEIWNKAHSVFFFKGRLRFFRMDGSQAQGANAPSCLVSYSEVDTGTIKWAQSLGHILGRLCLLQREAMGGGWLMVVCIGGLPDKVCNALEARNVQSS